MKKKITLKEIKVSSFATSLDAHEQEKAKGGYYYVRGNTSGVSGGKQSWTEVKTAVDILDVVVRG